MQEVSAGIITTELMENGFIPAVKNDVGTSPVNERRGKKIRPADSYRAAKRNEWRADPEGKFPWNISVVLGLTKRQPLPAVRPNKSRKVRQTPGEYVYTVGA